jgi:hypothetical protein
MIDFFNRVVWRRIKSLSKTFGRVFIKSKSGVFSSGDMQKSRMKACRECPFFNEKSGMCDICGCIMVAKVKFKAARCGLEDEGKKSRWPV